MTRLLCVRCDQFKDESDFIAKHKSGRMVCKECGREIRSQLHRHLRKPAYGAVVRNKARKQKPQHLARWQRYGEAPPPFKAGTRAYARWYNSVLFAYRANTEGMDWDAYMAKAKQQAVANPPKAPDEPVKTKKLFGGAQTKAYQQWYYRTVQACKAQGGENWPEFFEAAKLAEMKKQGLLEPQVRAKPAAVVPFNPKPIEDGRLMFDFTVPSNTEHHLVANPE